MLLAAAACTNNATAPERFRQASSNTLRQLLFAACGYCCASGRHNQCCMLLLLLLPLIFCGRAQLPRSQLVQPRLVLVPHAVVCFKCIRKPWRSVGLNAAAEEPRSISADKGTTVAGFQFRKKVTQSCLSQAPKRHAYAEQMQRYRLLVALHRPLTCKCSINPLQ